MGFPPGTDFNGADKKLERGREGRKGHEKAAEIQRCQILPAPAAWESTAPGVSSLSCGDAGAACGTGFGCRALANRTVSVPPADLAAGPIWRHRGPAVPAVALPRAGPAAHQRASCSPGALIGPQHNAQEGNIDQPSRILPCRLPETPAAAAAPRLLGGEEKRIAFVRRRKKNYLKKKKTMRNVRAQGMVLASPAGDNAGKRRSISAHPLPRRARPAKLAGEGEILSAPRQPRLLRRAALKLGAVRSPAVQGTHRRSPAEPPAGPRLSAPPARP